MIGSNDHFLYALDLETGKVTWKTDLGERIFSKPLVDSGRIYLGSASGYFFCLDASTGSILWRHQGGGKIHYNACSDSDGVYFGGEDNHFYKISKSGQKIWDYKTTMKFWGECSFYNDLVITNSWDTYIYGIDRNTGQVVWKTTTGKYNYGVPEVYKDRVYFATHNDLYCMNAATGKILTHHKVPYLDFVIESSGYLWTPGEGLTKRTLDGDVLGTVRFGTQTTARPVALENQIIVSGVKRLYGVSKDLKILWEFKAEDDFWSSGVFRNDIYYVGNRGSYVYALRLPK